MAATHLADIEAAKALHDSKLERVLLKMRDQDNEFCLQVLLQSWSALIREKSSSELKNMVDQLKVLQGNGVRQFVFKLAAEEDSANLHAVTMCWHKAAMAARQAMEMSKVQMQIQAQDSKIDRVVTHTMMQLAISDGDLLLHMVLKEWFDYLAQQRELEARAAELGEYQRLKELHDNQIAATLYKMEDERGAAHLQLVVNRWRSAIEDAQHQGLTESLVGRAEHFKEMHGANVRKLLYKLAVQQASTCLASAVGAWKQLVGEDRISTKMKEHLRDVKQKHDHVLEQSLICWNESDTNLLQHTVLRLWCDEVRSQTTKVQLRAVKQKHDHVLEQSLVCWNESDVNLLQHTVLRFWLDEVRAVCEMDVKAAELAEQAHVLQQHYLDKIRGAAFKWSDREFETHMQLTFQAWMSIVRIARRDEASLEIADSAARYRALHWNDTRKLLGYMGHNERYWKLSVCLTSWSAVLDLSRAEAWAARSFKAAKERGDRIAEGALLHLGTGDKRLLLHMVLRAFSSEAFFSQQTALHRVHLEDQRHLQGQRDALVDRVAHKGEYLRSIMMAFFCLRSAMQKTKMENQALELRSELSRMGVKREVLLEAAARHFGTKVNSLVQAAILHAWCREALKDVILSGARAEHLEEQLRMRQEFEEQLCREREKVETDTAQLEKNFAQAKDQAQQALDNDVRLPLHKDSVPDQILMERNNRLAEELKKAQKMLEQQHYEQQILEKNVLAMEIEIEEYVTDSEHNSACNATLLEHCHYQAQQIAEFEKEIERLQERSLPGKTKTREQQKSKRRASERDELDVTDLALMTMASS
eukprot:gnl/MRDRNA2_/MRDRNA2_74709_c0_seq2.p1 gnl/MRDRNA2_/MRDRNA2_74709_c0~~gnl/MRDRNA2_/MRDRNA2_74709_c0_seq2.p1  ORF type:complete len:847 (-),score=220.23 gnl/MRDRNA2_/MRDRNA2_74709_c0_seq2:139-2583(-)